MTVRRFCWAAALGLAFCLSRLLHADEPPRLTPPAAAPLPTPGSHENQKLADSIAGQLRQSGTLRHYSVDIAVRGEDVELTGTVTDQGQREEVHRLVQGMPGVARVIDRMTVNGATGAIRAVQDTTPPGPPKLPEPLPGRDSKPNANGPMPAPAPIFQAPVPAFSELNPPRMPPYAWPTYAPYNNYSRVAHPCAYPWQSWPFIGPVYPFPKVPLGWRSVKLEWDDGHWWYSRVGTKHDWWKLRYW